MAVVGLGGPFAIFCIVRCGMPGLVCRHPSGHGLCRMSNPEYDFFHMLWHLSSGLGENSEICTRSCGGVIASPFVPIKTCMCSIFYVPTDEDNSHSVRPLGVGDCFCGMFICSHSASSMKLNNGTPPPRGFHAVRWLSRGVWLVSPWAFISREPVSVILIGFRRSSPRHLSSSYTPARSQSSFRVDTAYLSLRGPTVTSHPRRYFDFDPLLRGQLSCGGGWGGVVSLFSRYSGGAYRVFGHQRADKPIW